MRESAVWVAGAVIASLVGCAGASPSPAEQPEPALSEETPPVIEPSSTSGAATGAGADSAGPGGEEATGAAEPSPKKKKKEDSIPDDYSLMHGDCVQLGKQFAALTRSDQVAALSPKLTAQQRSQTEQRIEVVAGKLGEQYTQTCEKNVGKSVSPQALKCAFDARSVKDFDACLNAPAPSN